MVVAVGVIVFAVNPKTEPTLLSIESVVGAPPESVHDKITDCPRAMVVESAANDLIIGEGGFTVTVINFVTEPEMFTAVMVYVVVAIGFTVIFVLPKTLPTPLSMLKVVGAPPDKVQDKVAEFPEIIVVGLTVNLEITGTAGFTITVTDFAVDP